MITHWAQIWIAIPQKRTLVVLHDEGEAEVTHAVVDLFLVQPENSDSETGQLPPVQALLDEFSDVFASPTGLPPRCPCDHQIPLLPGA